MTQPVMTDLERRKMAMEQALAAPAPSPTNAEVEAERSEAVDDYSNSFVNMLAQNEAYRKQQSSAWEKREKEARSRKTIAAVSDALSSLGNLVGTAYGAAPQQQTYQMPFITQQTEQDRAIARATADRIRATEQNLLASQASYDTKNPFALERLRHQNKMEQIEAQSKATNDAIGLRGEESRKTEGMKQENRVSIKEMDLRYKGDRDKMMADLKRQGIQVSREKLDEMVRHNQTMEVISEKKAGNGGNVGGYKVIITRDEFGREVSRERVPTTKEVERKPNPMGEGKKKNPMN